MTAALARLATEQADGRPPATRISTLRSGWPLMVRTTTPAASSTITAWANHTTTAATVHLAAGGAGPLGGDHLRLEVQVGPGSALVLSEVSPTLLLPGPHGEESHLDIDIRVGAAATLAWLPALVIAAAGCRHRTKTHVTLGDGARLLLREEVLLGRHGEQPGTLAQRLRVVAAGRPVYDQQLAVGPEAPGWDGPVVTADHRTVGSVLVVDHPEPQPPTPVEDGADHATAMTLPGPAVLLSALADDTAVLRRRLDTALQRTLRSPPT